LAQKLCTFVKLLCESYAVRLFSLAA